MGDVSDNRYVLIYIQSALGMQTTTPHSDRNFFPCPSPNPPLITKPYAPWPQHRSNALGAIGISRHVAFLNM